MKPGRRKRKCSIYEKMVYVQYGCVVLYVLYTQTNTKIETMVNGMESKVKASESLREKHTIENTSSTQTQINAHPQIKSYIKELFMNRTYRLWYNHPPKQM